MQDAPSIWPALLAFGAVIALIPLALWVLKRLQGGVPGSARPVTLIGGLTLGPRERVAVIEAQGRRWMIGVTGQSITLLAELDGNEPAVARAESAAAASPGIAPNPFSQILDRLKRHG